MLGTAAGRDTGETLRTAAGRDTGGMLGNAAGRDTLEHAGVPKSTQKIGQASENREKFGKVGASWGKLRENCGNLGRKLKINPKIMSAQPKEPQILPKNSQESPQGAPRDHRASKKLP